jgi:hypothetical protein
MLTLQYDKLPGVSIRVLLFILAELTVIAGKPAFQQYGFNV